MKQPDDTDRTTSLFATLTAHPARGMPPQTSPQRLVRNL